MATLISPISTDLDALPHMRVHVSRGGVCSYIIKGVKISSAKGESCAYPLPLSAEELPPGSRPDYISEHEERHMEDSSLATIVVCKQASLGARPRTYHI